MNQVQNPMDHLKEEIENMEGNAQMLREFPEKCPDLGHIKTICRASAADIDRSIREIKEIFADMKKLIQKNNGQAQRINLVIKGKIGGNRGRWYAPPKYKEATI